MKRTLETRAELDEIAGRVGYWVRRFGYETRCVHVQTVGRGELGKDCLAEIRWDADELLVKLEWPMRKGADLDDLICHELVHVSYREEQDEDHCNRMAAILTGRDLD